MVRGRLTLLAAIGAAVVALALPAGASAQGGGPFPDDQQPISDEYGLPPVDHPANSGGGGVTAGRNSTDASGGSGAGPTGASLSLSDVRRGEHGHGSANGSAQGGARPLPRERIGIGKPVPPPSTANAADPRSGFDILVLVLVGLAAATLVVAAIGQRRRPRRPT